MGLHDVFNKFGSLFSTFGWWSIALIAATVGIMIPINLLWKKLMKKEELARLRKVVSFLSVYVVAIILVSIVTAIFSKSSFTDFGYLSGSTLALGFCAQVVWELIKIIRDYGFKKFIAWISEKIDWKKSLKKFAKQYNIDSKIVDYVADAIEDKYLKNIDTADVKIFEENEGSMILDIHQRLSGFVATENLEEIAKGVYNLIKEAWIPSKETVKQEQPEVIEEVTEEKSDEQAKDGEYIELD